MTTLETLKEYYEQYEAALSVARQKASAFSGILGLGDDPRKSPCHDVFYHSVGQWTADLAASNPSAEDAMQAVRFILEAAHLNRDKEIYWLLFAVHGHTKALIPFVSVQDCQTLLALYDDLYPKKDRMPVQQEIYKLLMQYSGQTPPSGSFFKKLFGK